MKIEENKIAGSAIVTTQAFKDFRGEFARFFCKDELAPLLKDRNIVNVNFSHTIHKGTVRGMHFQIGAFSEMKMVRCIKGAIYDIVIDLRRNSPTFMQWYGHELTDANQHLLVIPEGCAHGFQALNKNSEILYLTTAHYSAEHERGVHPQDPLVGIDWPLPITEMSEKDAALHKLPHNYTGI